MPQSSRHKSHKHSKYSSKEAKDKDCSDSEEDVRMKEKSSKGDSTRAYRDSASGEKHKISLQVRKGKDGKDLSCDGKGEASEEYVSSKRRKEKAHLNKERADVSGRVSGDRWDGAGEERGRSDRNLEKEINKGGSSKTDLKLKESNNKGESLRFESKSKSKKHESGTGGESKENVESLVVEKDESKSKREPKRKSERIALEWSEGKELKDKERRIDKDKKGGQESKHGDAEAKAMDGNLENNQSSQLGDLSGDRQRKRGRENTGWALAMAKWIAVLGEFSGLYNETKYSDYAHEEKIQYKITSTRDYASSSGGAEKISSSRSLEKLGQNDSHLGELSAERHLKSDILTSPLQPIYKSPSSSTDRRHLSKSNVRRSLDIEDSALGNSGSRDVKDYFGKGGRVNSELAMDAFPGDELSQPDGDTLSASSPFSRNSRLSRSSKPLLPPPFRTGMDSRRRRIGDPNVGRVQGNAWGGVPNWPSPVANGFIPFPHGQPPVGFHSMMQPFPVPSIFGVRPSVDLNHSQGPYHMPDADRFSGHGPSMGWHNAVDDSRRLPLHGWNASNAVFSDEPHIYERPDWDPSRTFPGDQGWETSGNLWNGPNRTASMERPSSSEKQNNFVQGDEVSAGQNEQTQRDQKADSADISQLSDSSEKNAGAEAPHVSQEETIDLAKMSRKDDVQFCHVYLSKLDISADLTEPELFKQWASIIDTDQNIISDLEDSEILYMEQAAEPQVGSPGKTSSVSLFAVKNDSVFQKAMSHYKRQPEVFRVINEEKQSLLSSKIESIPKLSWEELNVENDKVEELSPAGDMQDAEDDLPNSNEVVEHPNCSPMMERSSRNLHQKIGVPVIMNITEKSEELIPALDHVNGDVDKDSNLDPWEHIAEKNDLYMDNEGSDAHLLAGIKEVPTESAGNVQELKSVSTNCGNLLNSDVSCEACEGKMPESEYGLVNLSRIHNSPESTR
ncbi:unnamed protein product [Fraxinus pennsylvanica]|uniref:Uncharacterized protein n=1 Tax=Fraxinus pennsylvanica TaxID=56036 RepID=A0AAD1YYJ8_9LAMI|nr:unnamed protein product [Fraxinus pennsylvanica]